MQYIIILLLLINFSYAKESDFSIIIDKPFSESLLDITQDYDRKISAVGFSRSYKVESKNQSREYSDAFEYLRSVSSNSHGPQIQLIKIDDKAKVVLKRSTKLSEFNEAVAVVKTHNNGYFVGGYTLNGSLIILKLDSNGNQIFKKIFGTKNYDRMNNLILLRDGGVLCIGSSTTTRSQKDNLFETGLGLNDIYVTRFTKRGVKLWSKKYGGEYDDRGIDACEAFDGSIIVLGSTGSYEKKNISIMRITENGDKIWLKKYESKDNITAYKIIKLRDNNFLVSLTTKENIDNEQIRFIKFDLNQNILIDKKIYTTYSSALKDIKEYSNGNIIGVGYVKDSYDTDALVMIFDKNLNQLNQEHYGEDNYDLFNAVTILHNSQAAAAGLHTQNNLQASNMWIVKLNRDGTIAQKLTTQTDFYTQLVKTFQTEIDANILSIKRDLSIDFLSQNLYFKVGKYILTPKQKEFLLKFSNKLIPVLHSYQNIINTIEINGHTSSEWGGANFTNRYLKNEKLSMNRAYSTLEYIFKSQNLKTQSWLVDVIKGSGLSYSKKVLKYNEEDKEKSRRVSFKIILNDKR